MFADLQVLRSWLTNPTAKLRIAAVIGRLGPVAIPLLGRALASSEPARRNAARVAILIAGRGDTRPRAIDELRSIAIEAASDDTKAIAIEILATLGEPARPCEPVVADASSILRRSVGLFAAQLESRTDITSAADLVVRQAKTIDVIQFLALLREIAPASTAALEAELAVRLDLPDDLRAQIAEHSIDLLAERKPARSAVKKITVAILVDAAARLVVIASRKIDSRRVRRWAVLINHAGKIDDCLYDIAGVDSATELVVNLCKDGYQVASTDRDRARALITGAARRTGAALTSQYYFGRDLLDLEDAHVASRPRSILARAVELLEEGKLDDAESLLERCDATNPDVAGARATVALARGETSKAIALLDIAVAGDPEWPLHHWNLGVAKFRASDSTAAECFRRFVTTSAQRSGLVADPEQPARVACAERMIAELDRRARLLAPTTKPRRAKRRRA